MSELMTRDDVRYVLNTIERELQALRQIETHGTGSPNFLITPLSQRRLPESKRETKVCTVTPQRRQHLLTSLAWMMFVFTNFDAFETNLSILEPPGLTISRFRSFGRYYLAHRASFQNIQLFFSVDEEMIQLAIEQFVHTIITEEQPAESEMKRPEGRLRY